MSASLNVTGGNNQFVVVYTTDPSGGAGASGASTAGSLPFGAPGSLNNTNPAYDFSSLNNGQVYIVNGDQQQLTINGGNQQFVVDYVFPAGDASPGGNTVSIDGGNNTFVVAYQYPGAGDGGGNSVSTGGGNNQFIVAYANPGSDSSTGGGNVVSVNGGNNTFVVAYNPPQSDGSSVAANGVSFAGQGDGTSNSSGVTVGAPGTNSIGISGDNNQYVVQYGVSDTSSAASGAAANPSGGSATGGAPSGIASESAGAPAGADLTSLLAQSPFGALLNLPGVTAQNLFSGVNPNDYSGSNPFAALGGRSSAYGGNPFASLGSNIASLSSGASGPNAAGANAASSNPFASTSSGAPAAATSPVGGMPSSNPIAGSSSASSAAPASGTAGSSSDGSASAAGANPFVGVSGAAGANVSSGDLGSQLAQSPFAPLLNLPGFSADALASSLSDGSSSSANSESSSDPSSAAPASSSDLSSSASAASAPTTGASFFAGFFGGTGASTGDLASQLAQSPFAPLLNLPGFSADQLTSSLAGGGESGPSYPSSSDYSGITAQNVLSAIGSTSQIGADGSSGPFASIVSGLQPSLPSGWTPASSLATLGGSGSEQATAALSSLASTLSAQNVPGADAFAGQLSSIISNFDPFAMGVGGSAPASASAGAAAPSAASQPDLEGILSALNVPGVGAASSTDPSSAGGVPSSILSTISGLTSSLGIPAQYLPSTLS